MNEALVGDAKKLAEAHLLVERRLKAAAVQQNRRRLKKANTQKLEAALAVITKAEECGVQVLPKKKKRATGRQANTSTEGESDAKRRRRAQPTERAARQQTRSHAIQKRNGRK